MQDITARKRQHQVTGRNRAQMRPVRMTVRCPVITDRARKRVYIRVRQQTCICRHPRIRLRNRKARNLSVQRNRRRMRRIIRNHILILQVAARHRNARRRSASARQIRYIHRRRRRFTQRTKSRRKRNRLTQRNHRLIVA